MERNVKRLRTKSGSPGRDMVQCSSFRLTNFIINKMDWIKQNIWQTLIVALITVVFSTIGSLYIYRATKKTDKIENAASCEYVDQKTGDLKVYIDIQDNEMKDRIEGLDNRMENKADKADIMEIRGLIKQQNDYLFQILKARQ